MRKNGRFTQDRLRAMRFALWAQRVPANLLTVSLISGLLDVSRGTAGRWRHDYLTAISAVDIDGIPSALIPNPEFPSIVPAATACDTTRS